ncbi:MAG: formylglycine-generating enzyme family protein [Elusimicrobia bacterium]|nr:formylglycine-generating enzyme family protein [Elusimicrobiota bacterium]
MALMNRCPFCMGSLPLNAVTCEHCKFGVTPGTCYACKKQNAPAAGVCAYCGGKYLIVDESGLNAAVKKKKEPAPPPVKEPPKPAAERPKPAVETPDPVAEQPKPASLSPQTTPSRALPKGFEKLTDELNEATGFPVAARCLADAAEMALIPAGKFSMGALDEEGARDEHPCHVVSLEAFYIDKRQVSVAQFRKFCAATKREMREQPPWSGDAYPVVNVNWYDATAYCEWARKSLPTEAEWEKAARSGIEATYSFGENEREIGDYTWYAANSKQQAHPSGEKKPNNYGLHEMPGNVLEWCLDGYGENYYEITPEADPRGSDSAIVIVCRGAAWDLDGDYARCAKRGFRQPDARRDNLGFRCVSSFLTPLEKA